MAILTLSQAVFLGLKIIEWLSRKKVEEPANQGNPGNHGNNPHPCKEHNDKLTENRERIIKLEEKFEAFKEDNKDDHTQLRENISRIFKLLNGARK